MKTTPLHSAHQAAGAKLIDFGGWEMPIHYGSQIDEHHAVRRSAGMFDVSHMTVVDLSGPECRPFLSRLLANDVAKLKAPGKALYACMLNQAGGVIDDLITYYLADDRFRLVVNAATRDKDIAWINVQAEHFDVAVNERPELAMIAVQGPQAREAFASILDGDSADAVMKLKKFFAAERGDLFVARTGYTGEDGFEITAPADEAAKFWDKLVTADVKPCGLGARDTLRLEAGMNLYGQDMDETVTPLESGLDWTVAMDDDRDFIGRQALVDQKENGVPSRQVGLVLLERGVMRHGQPVVGGGEITSGSYSPSLEQSVALARVPASLSEAGQLKVDIRGRHLDARIVRPPFVRDGKPLV